MTQREPELKSLLKAPLASTLYYDEGSRRFVQIDGDGGQDLTWEEATKWLGVNGIRTARGKGETASAADRILTAVRKYKTVHYCGPLAGYPAGCHMLDHVRFVVTEGANFIQPQRKSWRKLRAFLTKVLRDRSLTPAQGGIDIQLHIFHAWHREILQMLYRRHWRRTKVLALSGPIQSGKSFVQRHVTTPLFGGRSANPYVWMSGASHFNGELLSSTHLAVDDSEPRIDVASRRNMAAKIKELTANPSRRFEAKYRMPQNLIPLSAVSFSLNEEMENLQVLPALTPDVRDKIILLRFNPVKPQIFRNLEKVVAGELPGYLYWLLRYKPPVKALEVNGSVRSFKHPRLEEKLHETTPENAFEAMLLSYLKSIGNQMVLRKNATEIQGLLEGWPDIPQTLKQKVFVTTSSCGTHLGRLKDRKDSELVIWRSSLHGRTLWSVASRDKLTLKELMEAHINEGCKAVAARHATPGRRKHK
jgi:hypothetical protein